MQPKPCWIVWGSDYVQPMPGILLEWRKVEDAHAPGGYRWEGLVARAAGGGELPWHLTIEWTRAGSIRQMDAPPPAPPGGP